MLPRQRPRSVGNEAKSAWGKAVAKSSMTAKIGAVLALSTALTLTTMFMMTGSSKQSSSAANPIGDEQHKLVEAGEPLSPPVDRFDPLAAPLESTIVIIAPPPPHVDPAQPPDDVGLRPVDPPPPPPPQPPRLLTSDQYMYTGDDIPFVDEDVPSYRRRIAPMIVDDATTIFVSLASFRDDLCPATLLELFQKAKHPENIIVGLVDQVKLTDDSDDVACDSLLPDRYRRQVRQVRLTSREGRGPTHARYIASKLYEGEAFFLQIDSHSHFIQDWDENIMSQIQQLPNPTRNIITHYPPSDLNETGDANPPWICSTRQHKDAPPGLFVQESDWCYQHDRSPGIAVRDDGSLTTCVSPFMGGGFIFGPGRWVVDVPFDKYIPYIFHGEELLIASRLWTSGWDMFTPSQSIIDHKYGGRPKNVYAESNDWGEAGALSTARARHILGTALPGDDAIPFDRSELEYLGMGGARSYEAYLDFAGINLAGNSTGRCGQRFNWDQQVWEGEIKLMSG